MAINNLQVATRDRDQTLFRITARFCWRKVTNKEQNKAVSDGQGAAAPPLTGFSCCDLQATDRPINASNPVTMSKEDTDRTFHYTGALIGL